MYKRQVIATIVQRIKLKENIFEAHRHHLYQLLVNEMKWPHLLVASIYGFWQLAINLCIVKFDLNFWEGVIYLIIPSFLIYVALKFSIFKKSGAY